MTKKHAGEKDPAYWLQCRFPETIAEYLANFPDTAKASNHPALQRARRFRTFWEENPNEEARIVRCWKALSRAARSADSVLHIFLVMPDEPSAHPYARLYGIRKKGLINLAPKQERERYCAVADDVHRVVEAISSRKSLLKNLLQDAGATGGDVLADCAKFRASYHALRDGLIQLEGLLRSVDPAAKYPSGQPAGRKAALNNYVAQIASLHEYLKEPQPTALAYLTAVNNPAFAISPRTIGQAWARHAYTNT